MKRVATYVATLGLFLASSSASGQSDEVKEYCKSLVGQTFFLKVDVVRIESTIGGKDVTNVHPDGRVYYRGRVGSGFAKPKETDTAEDFAAEARRDDGGNVRIYKQASPVTIHKIKTKKDEVNVGITMQSGSKSRISFKLEKGYTAADFQFVFEHAFASDESELLGADKTINIALGMSTAEVIELKGNPVTRAELGPKTILAYSDMKLVFESDELVDVQLRQEARKRSPADLLFLHCYEGPRDGEVQS